MKRHLLFLILFVPLIFLNAPAGHAQDATADSLLKVLAKAPDDTSRIRTYCALSAHFQNSQPDTSLLLARKALLMSQNINYNYGISWSLNQMAGALQSLGNYSKALEYYLDQLRFEEKINKPINLAIINLNIANTYSNMEEFRKGVTYAHAADSIISRHNLKGYRAYSELSIGELYEKSNQLDSALFHTIKANEMARTESPELTGPSLNNLGNIYRKMEFGEVAKAKYFEGLPYLKEISEYSFMCESYMGLAEIYIKSGNNDSALYFASLAHQISADAGLNHKTLLASNLLSGIYRTSGKMDSAFHYLKASIAMKDSIFSKDKIRLSKEMEIAEDVRQAELALAKAKEEKERKASMQWLGIGIFIPLFLLLTLYMSRKKVKVKIIRTAGVISLLLLFEYITLLLHPRVKEITHHIPILETLVFVVLAALLTPTHHRIEHLLIRILTSPYQQKNDADAHAAFEARLAEDSAKPGHTPGKERQDDPSHPAM